MPRNGTAVPKTSGEGWNPVPFPPPVKLIFQQNLPLPRPYPRRKTHMRLEVLFYNQVISQGRPGWDVRNPTELGKIALYINRAQAIAKGLGLSELGIENAPTDYRLLNQESLLPLFYKLESVLNKIYGENLFEIDGNLRADRIDLDENWRSKVHAYLAHIRSAVEKAELPEKLRPALARPC